VASTTAVAVGDEAPRHVATASANSAYGNGGTTRSTTPFIQQQPRRLAAVVEG
jgi:hypothetical protein